MFEAIGDLFGESWVWNTSSVIAIACLVLTVIFWVIRDNYADSAKDYYYHIFNALMYISLTIFIILFGRALLINVAEVRQGNYS